MTTWIIETDGACAGNPGPAAYGFVIRNAETGAMEYRDHGSIGSATNNIAEYEALIHALLWALDHDLDDIEIRSDSELLVRQVQGIYTVRSKKLLPLYHRALDLLNRFESWSIRSIPREQNRAADRLARAAIQRH